LITVQLNGQSQKLDRSKTIQEILDQFKIDSAAIAVAVNTEIVPRSKLNETRVADGDQIEIVQARGGG